MIYLQKGENKVIIVDSPNHEVYDVLDTRREYLFSSVLDINKKRKKVFKVVNDIKSQLIMHNNAEEFIRKTLRKNFSDYVVEKLIKLSFADYLK